MNLKKIMYILCLLLITTLISAQLVNEDKPQKGIWDLKAKKIWEIDIFGDGQFFAYPRSVNVLDNGTILVHDGKQKKNFLFSNEGKFLSIIGKIGQGPEEIAKQRGVFSIKNKYVIFDNPSKYHYFSDEGKYLKFKKLIGHFFPRIFINEDQFISIPNPFPNTTELPIQLINSKTENTKNLAKVPYKPIGTDGRRMLLVGGLTPEIICGYDSINQKIIYGFNDKYKIIVMDLEGKQRLYFELKRKKQKINLQTKKKMVPDFMDLKFLKRYPDELTYYNRISSMNGLIIIFKLHRYDIEQTQQQIDIFSLKGTYLYKSYLKMKEGVTIKSFFGWQSILIRDSHLYIFTESGDGEIRLEKYMIVLPK